MERRENDPRQSSLPSSLIPHLFTAPQQPRDSSTRTTLAPSITPSVAAEEAPFDIEQTYMHVVSPSFPMTPLVPHSSFESRPGSRTYFAYESEHHDRQLASSSVSLAELSDQTLHRLEPSIPPVHGQRFASPIYSDPVFHASRPTIPSRTPSYTFPPPATRENVLQRTSWREGEAGPSSLLPAIRTDQRTSRGRRGSSQPARLGPQTEMFERGSSSFDPDVPFGDMARRESEREGYLLSSGSLGRTGLYGPSSSHSFQGLLPPLLVPSSGDLFGQQNVYTYPSTPLNITSSGSTSSGMRGGSPGLEPMYPSETRFDPPSAFRSTEYGSDEASQKGKKRRAGRRADSVEMDDDSKPRKSRNPRKTAVACNFCRGRKLRCNGAKPSCYNCTVRKFECEYVPIQRRRGPGKAPRGSRSKKASTSGRVSDASLSTNAADRRPSPLAPADYPPDILVPELRPYTSGMSLDKFSFQPPDSSPPYPSAPIPGRMREMGPHAQTPRSRETSSEDGSDAEEFYRKMG